MLCQSHWVPSEWEGRKEGIRKKRRSRRRKRKKEKVTKEGGDKQNKKKTRAWTTKLSKAKTLFNARAAESCIKQQISMPSTRGQGRTVGGWGGGQSGGITAYCSLGQRPNLSGSCTSQFTGASPGKLPTWFGDPLVLNVPAWSYCSEGSLECCLFLPSR